MADNQNPRLYRGADIQRGMSSGTPAPAANDPLAELARLIGQNDPFAEYGRDAARQPSAPAEDWNSQAPAYDNGVSSADQHFLHAQQQMPEAAFQPHAAPYDQQHYGNAPVQYPGYAQAPVQPAPYPEADYGHAPQGGYFPAADTGERAPPGFLARQQNYAQPAFGQETHPQDDPYYDDDAPAGRKRGILLAGAAAALIIVGTAGAFGYRALFGSGTSGPPPVIKADTSPTKITPATQRDSSSGKAIQDRIADADRERIVSREEQPADFRPQPRVVFPGPAANAPAPATAGSTALASTEPKKIRTVAIRPDQQGANDAPAPAAAAPQPAAASRAAAPAAPAPAVRAVAPQPAPAASNGPLSLSPDGGQPALQAAPPPARVAAVPPRAAAPVAAAPVSGGAYVQVSSQRSEGDAQASFRALQTKYPAVLGGKQATIHRADLGDKGTYYRAWVGPYSGSEAVELCGNLKAAGGSCIIQKN